ncbi:putative ankyrin repeat-containing domain protein [Fusarium austroafricanum]|uniref:Putative ankyrin repeat-containing domain protein n=1 Tax=Fusarium austroafricanum TaxID=2364996 RepID=A0A8H4NU50_9HYPO|nr:putative ankyrin repeat-containing domain protein [Fusarium austroafricanum]
METRRPQPTEAEWLQHKTAIGQLYIVEEMPLKTLVAEVGNLGLAVTKAQLEYKLKLWGFRRNISGATWAIIDHRINKRHQEGKESQVVYRGKRLSASTVENQRKRHCYKTTIDKFVPGLPNILQSGQAFMPRLPQELGPSSTLNFLPASGLQIESTDTRPRVSKIAATTRNIMPEAYPGEHLERAQVLLHGSNKERLQECLKMLSYKLSNNHLDSFNDEEWKISMGILRCASLLNLKVDPRSSEDIAVYGFMGNMFRTALQRIRDNCNINAYNINDYVIDDDDINDDDIYDDDCDDDYCESAVTEALTAVRWLLSMGQNPNMRILDKEYGDTVTPLQFATISGCLDLVELLLQKGADISPIFDSESNMERDLESIPSPLELALDKMYLRQHTPSMHIADCLLDYGASMDWDHALHLAIRRQHLNIADRLVRRGADLSIARPTTYMGFHGLRREETALSVAAEVGREATEFVLNRLELDSLEKMNKIITADVFISAAEKGNDDVIRLLYEISSSDLPFDKYGITPLHAAAKDGHLSTCRLLFQLWGPCPEDVTQPSPIHLASSNGHQDVVRFFIERGADIESLYIKEVRDQEVFRWAWHGLHGNDMTFEFGIFTPLQLALMGISGHCHHYYGDAVRKFGCAILLIEAGAQLQGGEVVLAASEGHNGLLSAALGAGGDPNEKSDDGTTALQWTLSSLCKGSLHHQMNLIAIVELFFKQGATLAGGEVVLAILSGNLDLAALIVSNGGKLADTGEFGITALEAAILSQNQACIDFMLPPWSNAYDAGALCAAIETGNHSCVWQLLANRPSHLQVELDILETTAIALAARSGDINILRKLLENPPCMNTALLPLRCSSDSKDRVYEIDGNDPHEKSFWRHHLPYRRARVREDPVRGSPLVAAAITGNTEACCELLRAGYQPDRLTWYMVAVNKGAAFAQVLVNHNQRVQTLSSDHIIASHISLPSPLIPAIKHNNIELLLLLLEAGADVNEHDRDINSNRSPLQQAAELGNLEMIECLLKAGADVNLLPALENGATALQFAAINGHLGIAKYLLEMGALIDAPGAALKGSRTALEGAAEMGRLDVIKFLLCQGALTTGPGRLQYIKSIQYAADEGHEAAEVLLREVRDWLPEDERLLNVYMESRWEDINWRWVETTDAGEGKWIPVPFWDWEDEATENGEYGADRDDTIEDEIEKQVAAASDGANITEWPELDIDDIIRFPD